jgi:ribosomal protein S18 acetylase RimI-like enzyme
MTKAIDKENYVRRIDRASSAEIGLVARRMQLTLEEVLGEDVGRTMYSLDWLINRVEQHINGELEGEVFVSLDNLEMITGHTIVRRDRDAAGNPIGLFSTIYVTPESRRQSIASQLITIGEHWMLTKDLKKFSTYTSESNIGLIKLFEKHGYQVTEHFNEQQMVIIEKVLNLRLG